MVFLTSSPMPIVWGGAALVGSSMSDLKALEPLLQLRTLKPCLKRLHDVLFKQLS